jgi:thymidylate synthase (FAD)
MDLHNLFRFIALRLDGHAQKEIRDYAAAIFDIAKKVAPSCCASFERTALRGVSFDGDEVEELRRRLRNQGDGPLLQGKALERFEEKLATGRQL